MILFFDGVCGLCNHVVDFLLKRDRLGRFRFAPLQGATAKEMLRPEDISSLASVVVVDGSLVLRQSDAVLHALSALGGAWSAFSWLARLIPRPLRDVVYDRIASNRYAWFGRRDTCRLPSPDERARFLD